MNKSIKKETIERLANKMHDNLCTDLKHSDQDSECSPQEFAIALATATRSTFFAVLKFMDIYDVIPAENWIHVFYLMMQRSIDENIIKMTKQNEQA